MWGRGRGIWNRATLHLVMPFAKMGKPREEQVGKGNQKFCFGHLQFKMSTDVSTRKY